MRKRVVVAAMFVSVKVHLHLARIGVDACDFSVAWIGTAIIIAKITYIYSYSSIQKLVMAHAIATAKLVTGINRPLANIVGLYLMHICLNGWHVGLEIHGFESNFWPLWSIFVVFDKFKGKKPKKGLKKSEIMTSWRCFMCWFVKWRHWCSTTNYHVRYSLVLRTLHTPSNGC